MIPFILRKIISFLIPFKFINFIKPTYGLKRALTQKSIDDCIKYIFIGFENILEKDYSDWIESYNYLKFSKNSLDRLSDLNIMLWLEGDSNVKIDRASMINSMELRSPFLDFNLIELSRRIPINMKINRKESKFYLKQILRKLLKKEFISDKKKGFAIPLKKWINDTFKDEILTELNKGLSKIPNISKIKFEQRLNDHFNGKRDNSRLIWRTYILIKWLNNKQLNGL